MQTGIPATPARPSEEHQLNDRTVGHTIIHGVFLLPPEIKFHGGEFPKFIEFPRFVEVSTVELEEPEHGFETMMFLNGCRFFSIFTAQYSTREAAEQGHKSICERLLAEELPLAIPLSYYHSYGESYETEAAARAIGEK